MGSGRGRGKKKARPWGTLHKGDPLQDGGSQDCQARRPRVRLGAPRPAGMRGQPKHGSRLARCRLANGRVQEASQPRKIEFPERGWAGRSWITALFEAASRAGVSTASRQTRQRKHTRTRADTTINGGESLALPESRHQTADECNKGRTIGASAASVGASECASERAPRALSVVHATQFLVALHPFRAFWKL